MPGDVPPTQDDNENTVFVFDPTKKSGTAQKEAAKKVGAKTIHDKRKEKVEDLLNKIGMAAFAYNQFDGYCILERTEQAAEALADLADQNKSVAKIIDNATLVGGYTAVIAVVVSMVLPIVAYHGALPKQYALPVIAATAPKSAQNVLAAQMAAHAEQAANSGNSTA